MYRTIFFLEASPSALQVAIDEWLALQQEQRPSSFEIVTTSYAIDPVLKWEKVFIIYK